MNVTQPKVNNGSTMLSSLQSPLTPLCFSQTKECIHTEQLPELRAPFVISISLKKKKKVITSLYFFKEVSQVFQEPY